MTFWVCVTLPYPGVEKDYVLMFISQWILALVLAYQLQVRMSGPWWKRAITGIVLLQPAQIAVASVTGSYKSGMPLWQFSTAYVPVWLSFLALFATVHLGAALLGDWAGARVVHNDFSLRKQRSSE